MISSNQLDQTIIRFESNPKEVEKLLDHLQEEQSLLLDILIGTHAELLTDEEMDYLLFLFMGIYETFRKSGATPEFTEQNISKAEEFSWKILNEHNDYGQAIEIFYKEIKEAEVMEFIDLSIMADDENEVNISDPGRLIMLAVLTALTKLLEE